MSKAAFLDRDGVINIDKDYVCKIEDFEFKDGVFELLLYLQNSGYKLIIITNQSGIGRGYYSKEQFLVLTSWMKSELAKGGVEIASVYHCPHAPEDGCGCRKPESGMFEQAMSDFDIDMNSSLMIGDKLSDIEAARKAGVGLNIFVLGKNGQNSDKIDVDYKTEKLESITQFLKGRE